jgi:hypothetical protein
MNDEQPIIIPLSRPTFAELTTIVSKLGMTDSLCDDGMICLGKHHFVASDGTLPTPGRAARIAAQIADAAGNADCNDAAFDDGRDRIETRCRPDGVHIVTMNAADSTSRAVRVPYRALMPLAGDLIECLGRKHDS